MGLKEQYNRRKKELINEKNVNKDNKALFKEFFEWEENKLKRSNGIREIDEKSYKTLILYVHYFKNLNEWFKGKSWSKLTKEDIKRVYDDLEEGRIKKRNGEMIKDRVSYYNKVFKSKPFKIAGVKHIAEDVIEFNPPTEENVRFITEEDFRKLPLVAVSEIHKLMLWLLWDIGENVGSILELKKKNFIRQVNKETKEPEYLVVLNKEILKRSRTPRSELTHYQESVKLLDIILQDLKDEDKIFSFGLRQAEKIMKRCVKITKIKTKPQGDIPTLKDLRSGMACHLLGEGGWSSDEVKGRLGHKPSSRAIDKYISYLCINKNKPKKKIFDSNLRRMEEELEEVKSREKLKDMRIETLQLEIKEIKEDIKKL